ncbi:MAG: hypothetical protein MZV64_09440 [Ignavibacteriales bacterium]|nr:hypothetical protein [Ignavibacteriales bacterium]
MGQCSVRARRTAPEGRSKASLCQRNPSRGSGRPSKGATPSPPRSARSPSSRIPAPASCRPGPPEDGPGAGLPGRSPAEERPRRSRTPCTGARRGSTDACRPRWRTCSPRRPPPRRRVCRSGRDAPARRTGPCRPRCPRPTRSASKL